VSLAALTRRATLRPGESAAWCVPESRFLVERTRPRAAGQAARDHTRQTGHETVARHVQTISYRPAQP